jgi:hypothetical protein
MTDEFDVDEHLYERITDDQRRLMVAVTQAKVDLDKAQLTYNKLKLTALNDPSEYNLSQLSDFASLKLRHLRDDHRNLQNQLLLESVNVDKLKEILPVLLLALSQAIDVPLLLDSVGIDENMISEGMTLLKDFFKNGFDSF